MSAIPERVWALLTEEEQARLRQIANGWRYKPNITCPQCGAHLGVRLKITAGAVALDDEGHKVDPPVVEVRVPHRPVKESRLIEAAKTTGLLDAFKSAVMAEKEFTGIPADIEEFFLQFWKMAQPTKLNPIALAAWIKEFEGRIVVLASNGILAILCDGQLRAFAPQRLTRSTQVVPGVRIPNDQTLDVWIKSKFGYVPVNGGAFSEALRQSNIGKFGTLVQ